MSAIGNKADKVGFWPMRALSAYDPKRTLCSQGTLGLAQLLMCGSSCKTTFSNEVWISIWPL